MTLPRFTGGVGSGIPPVPTIIASAGPADFDVNPNNGATITTSSGKVTQILDNGLVDLVPITGTGHSIIDATQQLNGKSPLKVTEAAFKLNKLTQGLVGQLAHSLILVAKYPGGQLDLTGTILLGQQGGSNVNSLVGGISNVGSPRNWWGAGQGSASPNYGSSDNLIHIHSKVTDLTNYYLGTDGPDASQACAGFGGSPTLAAGLGLQPPHPASPDVPIGYLYYRALWYNRALLEAERIQYIWALGQQYGLVDSHSQVIWTGDSIAQGTNSLANAGDYGTLDYQSQCVSILSGTYGKTVNHAQGALGGTTSSVQLANIASQSMSLLRPLAPKIVWVHIPSINDALNSGGVGLRVDHTVGSVLQIWQTNTIKYCLAITTLGIGIRLILCTNTPPASQTTMNGYTDPLLWPTMAAWIRANYKALGAVDLIDFAADARVLDPTYHAEGTPGTPGVFPHFNETGQLMLAQIAAPVIARWC